MLKEKRLAKKTLVATVMSNMGLARALEGAGGKLMRTAVGDRYVVEAMRKHKLSLGGEQSGHLIFLDHATTGDGCVAALQMLAALQREQRPMSELARVMERVPQVLESIQLKRRMSLDEMKGLTRAITSVEKKLGKNGRVLVRWSGTEPKLRLMAEGPDTKQLRSMLKDLAEAAKKDVA
jgi:phosphoglucosamine mutase